MKIFACSILLFVSVSSFAQTENKFDSVYTKIMAIVDRWESPPLEVSKIRQRNFSGGRKSNLTIALKLDQKDNRIQKKKIKIRYSRSGIRFEKTKLLVDGTIVGKTKKMNNVYLFTEINILNEKGDVLKQLRIANGKYIIDKDYRTGSKLYFVKN
jgi:hypothetical protein